MTSSTLFGAGSQASAQIGGAIGGAAGAAVAVGGKAAMGMAGNLLGALFGGRRDPSVAFNYMVEVDGMQLGMFLEAGGIKWSMKVDEVREGGVNNHQQHLLGRAQFDPLELKRGFVGKDSMLYNMMNETFDPNTPVYRKIVHVVVTKRGTNGGLGGMIGLNEIGRLTFHRCFVQEWTGPAFTTKSNEIAVESIKFRYDWLTFHPGGALDQLLDAGLGAAMSLGGGMLAGKTPSI